MIFPVLWSGLVSWVGASHRVNLMHLSPFVRNDQEKLLCTLNYNNCRWTSPICDYLLYRCWTRGLVFELPPRGLHVLPRALRAVLSRWRNTHTLFATNKRIHCVWRCCWIHIIENTFKNLKNASLNVRTCTSARHIWPYFKWHQMIYDLLQSNGNYKIQKYNIKNRYICHKDSL